MKLLMINPNTTPAMTTLMRDEAQEAAAPATEIVAVTGRFGARYVASRAAYAIAGHAALDAYAEHGADADVVLYRRNADLGRMFAVPARVYKAGVLVAEDGEIRALPRGQSLAAPVAPS